MSNEIDEKKTKYFIVAILLLIILSIILVIHFNNKSLVSGEDEEITTTTTTKQITTTRKKITKKIIQSSTSNKEKVEVETLEQQVEINKTTIDKDNKLIYNYKTSNKITDTDIIVSKILNVDETLKNNNIVKLFDISLYDINMIKKEVNNSIINISIPLSEDLIGYDEYKIVYIDNENKISNEEFETKIEDGYIKFTTTHLSKFGVVATKKDLESVKIEVKINDELIENNNIYVNKIDRIDINISGLECEYKLYYLLKDNKNDSLYQEFNNYMFEEINTPSKYTLLIKIEVNNMFKVFEIGTISIYDIVFEYDKTVEIEKDIILGEIKDENGLESTYVDKETNKNIVIDNVEIEQEVQNTKNVQEENITNEEQEVLDTENKTEENENNSEDSDQVDIDQVNNEEVAKIVLKGNIYLVEETDISNLEIKGYLIIDTSKNISFKTEEDKLLTSNIYTITIKNKEFSINGIKYTYEYINEDLVIKKVEDGTDAKEEIDNLFKDFQIIPDKEDLILANPVH